MSEQYRTPKEYTERYAVQYTGGDTELAAGHEIVKEVCETLEEKENE